jgi:hypothetical protein
LIKPHAVNILDTTTGLILLGTPHNGTDNLTAGGIVERIILANVDVHKCSLTSLKGGNEMVLDTVHDFVRAANERRMSIHCFFEQRRSAVDKMFNDKTLVCIRREF